MWERVVGESVWLACKVKSKLQNNKTRSPTLGIARERYGQG